MTGNVCSSDSQSGSRTSDVTEYELHYHAPMTKICHPADCNVHHSAYQEAIIHCSTNTHP